MVHELRQYTLTPQGWHQYRELFWTISMPIRGDEHGRLLGCWVEEAEQIFTFFHLWEYDSLDERTSLRSQLSKDPRWTDNFLPLSRLVVDRQDLKFLNPQFDIHTVISGDSGQPVYLHAYDCVPGSAIVVTGKLGEKYVWTTECPNPNLVLCLSHKSFIAEIETLKSAGGVKCIKSVSTRKLFSVKA